MVRTVFLILPAVFTTACLMNAQPIQAQSTQPQSTQPQPTQPQPTQAQPTQPQPAPSGATDIQITNLWTSGWVYQIGTACLTCFPPEVSFCLSDQPRPTSCSTYLRYSSGAKDQVEATYTALLTALSANKPVSAGWPPGGTFPPSSSGLPKPGSTSTNPQSVTIIRVLATLPQPPYPSPPAYRWYDYVTAVHIQDDHLFIAVKNGFNKNHTHCNDTTLAVSAFPITDQATQAMQSVALASFLGLKKVIVWVAGCQENYAVMTSLGTGLP